MLPTAYILTKDKELFHLFTSTQCLLQKRANPIYITHIPAHTNLPGPLTEGNAIADALTHIQLVLTTKFERAAQSHARFHQNTAALRKQFRVTREEARQIVKSCSTCLTHLPQPTYAVSPRGLMPNHLWQMGVTILTPFGRLKYLHVSIDTFSGFLHATAHCWECFTDVQNHLLSAFATLGTKKAIKIDNGTAYTSQAFQTFFVLFSK